ncbi:MAG: hypothetical protein KIH89_003295 [Candidatus Shapirobacteria bacterium]|nr:hypothetical protein [Candidatus Shapirobacteria bacterium]
MKNCRFKTFIIITAISLGLFLAKPKTIKSNPVTNLRDQLSSAQLSYFGRLSANNTEGDSLITIITDSGSAPSTTNYNLFIGDTIAIARATTGSSIYTVSDIANTNSIFINTGLNAVNTFTGAYVVATRSAVHNISFSPESSISQGKWQILLKATNISGETPNDGMPDQGGFDLNGLLASDVTCPWSATASVGTTLNITSGIGLGSTGTYHLITCALGTNGTNPVGSGTTGTFIIGNVNKFINPSPATNHTFGQANASADTHTLIIRHTDENDNIISSDTTIGKIALTESVLVTATIDPTITFYIDNIGATNPGFNRCGASLSSGASRTTATSVNFGSLSLGQFNTLAQRFTCSTNAANGYTVQVFEKSPLTITNPGSSSTIADTSCDSGSTCDIDTNNDWDTDVSNSQFGYSLESINSSPVAFEAGFTFSAKPFGVGYGNARTIMSRGSTPSTEDRAYICYRITASNFQEAGTYQNQINFIATATF